MAPQFKALAAQAQELNDQLASLSAGITRMQSAMSEQSNQITAYSKKTRELELSNTLLRREKGEHNWANLDKRTAKARDLAIALRLEVAKK
ncbi:hypothetical protein AG0111_0g1027 [Alternaria gaisen]|uniref:Uncharacterized protein n=1 Tax=Alternaria gaisen TaxID=167740 RepID=A0ACB6G4S1_9PLEO|nr:hypothetical protein AG0111_0g1027 [Alternaria gaisen]